MKIPSRAWILVLAVLLTLALVAPVSAAPLEQGALAGIPWWVWVLIGLVLLLLFLWWLFWRRPAPPPPPPPPARPVVTPTVPPVERVATVPPPAVQPTPPPVGRVAAVAAVAEAKPAPAVDDLTRIEGIGPKTATALRAAGITTFAQLAATSEEELSRILRDAGISADPGTWPEQAALAAAGKWDELKAWQDELVGGIEQAPKVAPDDLTRIEGIGPKIQAALNAAGITTFAQLKATPVDEIRRILADAGIAGAFGDPTTWTEQARLAQAGQWDELQALQDRLKGGRT
jgi:DNA-directed RNA polymerase subunit beta'